MAQQETDKTLGISLPRKRFTGDAEMDITPMIDIVFLLLIFFLVASKMDEAATVKLPPARRGVNVSQENSIIVIVKKNGGDILVARRDGSPFSRDLDQQEKEIGEYVEAGLSGTSPFERPMESIIVKAQGDVREGDVSRVAEAIGKATEIPVLNYAVLEQQ